MHNLLTKYFVTALIILGLSQYQNAYGCSTSKTKQCTVEGLIGNQPLQVCRDICMLKQKESETMIKTENKREFRRLFYGPTGNGKTTLAKLYASLTNSEFQEYDGPSIVSQYQGSGAQKIQKIFEKAIITAKKSNKRVVIFIDEIDALISSGSHNDQNERIDDYSKTLEKFWLELDRCKDNPKIFVIVATNHFERLPAPFRRRFNGNTIELTNPDQETRVEMIIEFILLQTAAEIDKMEADIFEQKKTINQSYLNEYFSIDAQCFEEELNKFNLHTLTALNSEIQTVQECHDAIKSLNNIIEKQKKIILECDELIEQNKLNTEISKELLIIKKYYECLKKSLFLKKQCLKNFVFVIENQNYVSEINWLIGATLPFNTKGWSNAHLKTLINHALERAELENDGILTQQIFDEECDLIKKTIKSDSLTWSQIWKGAQEGAAFSRDVTTTILNIKQILSKDPSESSRNKSPNEKQSEPTTN